ncbi:MAG: RdgB/HAM1 family non-canonical purine NTP pyrophosphatase [Burkholderiales bacterium]|nr:RdgB/HAM1 family non-canonical purine NTP pyrophosphatase [Burkholderiales bacterium]
MRRVVLASNNPGKLAEFAALIEPQNIELVGQGALGIGEADEPHATFVENALAKARHASRAAGLPALADDSGICVAALGGRPGVHSARFAGEPKSDLRNNQHLIECLRGQTDRRAHYVALLVMVRRHDDPEPLIASGRWDGVVIDTPRGAHGFGYDPYFLIPSLGRTAAELDPAEKNRVSHRARALAALLAQLKEAW